MRTLRFHGYGEPADVLRLEAAEAPAPRAGHIRVRVHACGLNPADWALCRGLFAGDLPRGVGLDVSGTVDAVGEGVADVRIGDLRLGVRSSFEGELGYPQLGAFARLAAEGRFEIPVARTFPLEAWREALDLSLSGHARGKLVLLPG